MMYFVPALLDEISAPGYRRPFLGTYLKDSKYRFFFFQFLYLHHIVITNSSSNDLSSIDDSEFVITQSFSSLYDPMKVSK